MKSSSSSSIDFFDIMKDKLSPGSSSRGSNLSDKSSTISSQNINLRDEQFSNSSSVSSLPILAGSGPSSSHNLNSPHRPHSSSLSNQIKNDIIKDNLDILLIIFMMKL